MTAYASATDFSRDMTRGHAPRASLLARLVTLLIEADSRHRQNVRLRDLPSHLRHDIGLSDDQIQIETARPFHLPFAPMGGK